MKEIIQNTVMIVLLPIMFLSFLYFLGWAGGTDIFPRLTEKLGFEEYFTP